MRRRQALVPEGCIQGVLALPEMIDADLGPSFKLVAAGVEVIKSFELEILDGIFIGSHLVAGKFKQMHHA